MKRTVRHDSANGPFALAAFDISLSKEHLERDHSRMVQVYRRVDLGAEVYEYTFEVLACPPK